MNSNTNGKSVATSDLIRDFLRHPYAPVFEVGRRECSGFESGLFLAKSAVASGALQSVLLLTYGRISARQSRVSQDGNLVIGDGAASCIVSNEPGDLEVLDATTADDRDYTPTEDKYARSARQLKLLSESVSLLFQRTGVSPDQITYLLGTNGSELLLNILADAAQVSAERIYLKGLAEFGHAFSCDNLVGLKGLLAGRHLSVGDHILLISWSPRISGTAILKVQARGAIHEACT
jgi:3-oxoacyl-[acyl-carrier-protein] synthase-3